MTFLNHLDALIPKIPFSFFFFAGIRVRFPSGAPFPSPQDVSLDGLYRPDSVCHIGITRSVAVVRLPNDVVRRSIERQELICRVAMRTPACDPGPKTEVW